MQQSDEGQPELLRRYERLQEFQRLWGELDVIVQRTISSGVTPDHDRKAFEGLRSELNRLLPAVEGDLEPSRDIVYQELGVRSRHEVFGFLLQEVPDLSSFNEPHYGSKRKLIYNQSRAITRGLLDQRVGKLEHELAAAPQRPPIDLLDALVTESGLGISLRRLTDAETGLANGDDPTDVIADCRRAFEAVVRPIANAIASVAERQATNAVGVMKDHGLIDPDSFSSLTASPIGLYGWLSNHGSHEPDPAGRNMRRPIEAAYAVEWTRAALGMLLRAYVDYKRRTESA